MEKNVQISMLCQMYGNLLTEKQKELIDDYYNNDLSLSEIAENNNITRQAVRDIIKKGEKKLFEYENQISFLEKLLKQEKVVNEIKMELNNLKMDIDKKYIIKIDEIQKKLDTLI